MPKTTSDPFISLTLATVDPQDGDMPVFYTLTQNRHGDGTVTVVRKKGGVEPQRMDVPLGLLKAWVGAVGGSL